MAQSPHVVTDNIPSPDPSAITAREIAKAKQEIRDEFGLVRELLETRLNAMDQASVVLAENVNRVPTLLDRESARIENLRQETEKLFNEKLTGMETKFDSVQIQFRERDTRAKDSEQAMKESAAAQALSGTTAVNAALQAQKESAFATQQANKEAIDKSEKGFQERIKALEVLTSTSINELRSRLDRGEGGTTGKMQEKSETHANYGTILGGLAFLVSVAVLVVMIVGHPSTPVVIQSAPSPTTTTTTK